MRSEGEKEPGQGFLDRDPSTNRQDLPRVLRSKNGTVVWRIEGATEEENLRLGISNILGIFLEKFPEFPDLFPFDESGKIVEEKRGGARKFVLSKISLLKNFRRVISKTALNRSCCPYFKGSYLLAIEMSFSEWGLNLNITSNIWDEVPASYMRRPLRWKKVFEEDPETVILFIESKAREFHEQTGLALTIPNLKNSTVKYLIGPINRYFPGGLTELRGIVEGPDYQEKGFNYRVTYNNIGLPIDENGYVMWVLLSHDHEKARAIIKQVCSKFVAEGNKLTPTNLAGAGLGWVNTGVRRFYPGSFTELYADMELQLSKKPDGYWENFDNTRSEALAFYHKYGELTKTAMYRHHRGDLAYGASKYPGKITALRKDLEVLGIVRKPFRYWQDPDNLEREAKRVFSIEGRVDYQAGEGVSQVNKLLQNIRKYYPGGEPAIWQKLGIEPLPKVDRQTGIYLDEGGTKWVGLPYLASELGTNTVILRKKLKRSNVPHVDGIARNGNLAVLYDYEEAVRFIIESDYYKRKQKKSEEAGLSITIEAALDAYECALDSGLAISFREFLESFQDEE